MATLTKVYAFSENLCKAVHNLGSDTFKIALSNTAPTTASTQWTVGNFPAPTNANGYTAGGNTVTITSCVQSSGVTKWILVDSVFTATAGGIGPFRYAILYDDTAAQKIIGWYDYLSSITLNDTETFTVDFDGTNGCVQYA